MMSSIMCFGQMPIYHNLMKYMDQIGYFTFWLSIACIVLAYLVWKKRDKLLLYGNSK